MIRGTYLRIIILVLRFTCMGNVAHNPTSSEEETLMTTILISVAVGLLLRPAWKIVQPHLPSHNSFGSAT